MDYAAEVEFFFAPPPDGIELPEAVTSGSPARRLRDALEPVSMHAVWSEAVNVAIGRHGFSFFSGYVCGRAAPLGDVPSAVVAALFGVFEPGVVDAMWSERTRLPLPELIELRDAATAASLRSVLEPVAREDDVTRVAEALERGVEGLDLTGRALFAALKAQPRLTDPYARLWRAADLVREHRGDSHIAACVAAGLDPIRMGILAETWVGYPVGEYSGTRGWPAEASAAAVARLERDGLLADGRITPVGIDFREGIEAATDLAQAPLVAVLGGELDETVALLDVWSQACVDAHAFPPDVRKRAAG